MKLFLFAALILPCKADVKVASFAELAAEHFQKEALAERGLMGVDLRSEEYYEQHDLPKAKVITSAGRAGTGTLTKWLNMQGVPAIHQGQAPGAVSLGWWYAVPRYNIDDIRWVPALGDRRVLEWTPEMHKADQNVMSLAEKFPEKRDTEIYQQLKKPIHFKQTVHVVREPLDHIQSLARCLCSNTGNETTMRRWDDFSYKWAEHWIGNLGKGRLERAANYWLKYNELAGQRALASFRIEDLDETKLIEALGVQDQARFPLDRFSKMEKVDATPEQEKEGEEKLTWETLEKKVGVDLARKIKAKAEAYGYTY